MAAKPKKRRVERTYEEKLKILKYCDDNPTMKGKEVALHFKMSESSLATIKKDRAKIEELASNSDMRKTTLKRIKKFSHENVDEALLMWFRQKAQIPDLRVDGQMLLMQANKFRVQFDPEDTSTITMSWIERFKERYGINRIRKAGESAGVDQEAVRIWKEGKLEAILQKYPPSDIYNADETGLFWMMLPENSLGFAGQAHHGKKQPKTRVTVLVGANMDGSDKLPLLIIGKSMKPRAFKKFVSSILRIRTRG